MANGVNRTRSYMMNAIHLLTEDIKISQTKLEFKGLIRKIPFDINVYQILAKTDRKQTIVFLKMMGKSRENSKNRQNAVFFEKLLCKSKH